MEPEIDPHLFEPLQQGLKVQLTSQLEEVETELREKKNLLNRAIQAKENTGVLLYNVQTQLATLQTDLELKTEQLQDIAEESSVVTKQLDEHKIIQEEMVAKLRKKQELQLELQRELDKVSLSLNQVQQYDAAAKNEAALTRRVAKKAESDTMAVEKEMEAQNLRILQLDERLTQLNDEHGMIQAQLKAQTEESNLARETIREAADEIKSMHQETQRLIQHWQSANLALQKRADHLRKVEDTIFEQADELRVIEAEISSTEAQIRKVRQDTSQISRQNHRLELEIAGLQKQKSAVEANLEKLLLEHQNELEALKGMEVEIEAISAEVKTLEKERTKCLFDEQKVIQAIKDVEDAIRSFIGDHMTLTADAQHMQVEIENLRKRVVETNAIIIQMQNEEVRVDLDAIQLKKSNNKFVEVVQQRGKILDDKEKVLKSFELVIRRKHDEIAKKQNNIEFLNKKLEKVLGDRDDENLGPLEATIVNLQRNIDSSRKTSRQIEGLWLRLQTDLVQLTEQTNQLDNSIQDLDAQTIILTNKQFNLDKKLANESAILKKVNSEIENIHRSISRYNHIITEKETEYQKIAHENYATQQSFTAELKELEIQTANLEEKIAATMQERDAVCQDIIAEEQRILLWERKIQLHKETQELLDPETGQNEIKEMRHEISLMERRLKALKLKKAELLTKMQQMIESRDTIWRKSKIVNQKAKVASKTNTKTATQQSLNKEISRLKKRIDVLTMENKNLEASINNLSQQREEVSFEISELGKATQESGSLQSQLEDHIHELLSQKSKNLERLSRTQKRCERYNAVANGKVVISQTRRENAQEDFVTQKNRREALLSIVSFLEEQAPEMQRELDKLRHRLDVALEICTI
eukprot:TRINITY_DN3175_c0_g2_i2.p1 TRINITY_DN3175_c0_g2~~TRINITY_DN3175_c0_g2_i2.p1  ORF type:complete len:882 (+),score=223.56 TRINITY_DN3175_c0_g2_i2:35-2647(+)